MTANSLSTGKANTIAYSTNWSGYVVNTAGTPQVTAIWARWNVPTISSASPMPAYSSDWIGIGGYYGDNTLIQTGTEQGISSGGSTTYDAWYELIPAAEVVVFAVSPGDLMTASIQYQGSNSWSVSTQDVTNGHSWNNGGNKLTYTSTFYSAEWIHEATSLCYPIIGCTVQKLTKTSEVSFTDAKATIGSTSAGSIGDFSTIQVMMDDPNSSTLKVLAEPGCLPSKDRFEETYTGDLPQVPPVLLDCYVPLSVQAGTTLILNYYVFNDNPSAISYGLGAGIRLTGTTAEIDDQTHDTTVSVPAQASTWQSRQFYIQPSVAIGTYDWKVAV